MPITLQQDASNKLIVKIEKDNLYREIKTFFGWRKGDFKERLFKLGTYDHDRFIQYLADKGYSQ